MKIIAVANQKGGVGKTTTVLNVGCGLCGLGKRVLLIDLDPQAHLTTSFGIDESEVRSSVNKIFLSGGASLRDVSVKILTNGENGITLIPSTIDLSAAEIKLYAETGRDFILRNFLARTDFDYVFIDCPPNLGILTINAFTASDYLIVPVQTEYLATRGFSALLDTLAVVRERLNPGLEILGVLATMYDSRKVLDREIVEHIRKSFGGELFDTRIRKNVSLAEAPSHGESIYTYKPDSTGAEDYRNLCKEILGRMEAQDGKAKTRQ